LTLIFGVIGLIGPPPLNTVGRVLCLVAASVLGLLLCFFWHPFRHSRPRRWVRAVAALLWTSVSVLLVHGELQPPAPVIFGVSTDPVIEADGSGFKVSMKQQFRNDGGVVDVRFAHGYSVRPNSSMTDLEIGNYVMTQARATVEAGKPLYDPQRLPSRETRWVKMEGPTVPAPVKDALLRGEWKAAFGGYLVEESGPDKGTLVPFCSIYLGEASGTVDCPAAAIK